MPKRKSQKNNSQSSPEIAPPQKPAILRIVRQNPTDTSANSPAPPELSTVVPKENHPIEPELKVNNHQSTSIEVSEKHSQTVLTSDAVPQTVKADNEQSDLPLLKETAPVNLEELTANIEIVSDTLGETETEKELRQSSKKLSYKQLETATNSQGQTFTVGEEIEVFTCNFGNQQAVITFLYSAPDGSIWASYSPVIKEQKQQWRRGCCRIEHLLPFGVNPGEEINS